MAEPNVEDFPDEPVPGGRNRFVGRWLGPGRDRRRWLFGILLVALLAFNYPVLFVVEAVLGPSAVPLFLFGSWAMVILSTALAVGVSAR